MWSSSITPRRSRSSSAGSWRRSRRRTSRRRSRTTTYACASIVEGARSTRAAWTMRGRTSRRWKTRRYISMNGSTLVSTGELEANLAKWRVFDCRHDLAKPDLGEQQYKEGHIPGALFAHLDRDLSGRKTGSNGRHPLPDPQDFEKWLEHTGLTPKDHVVCYDGGTGAMAARLWWMLHWSGPENVAVLDGGFAKWTKEGRPGTVDVPLYTLLNYPIKLRKDFAVDVRSLEKSVGKSLLLDARAPARYRGEQEPIDPVAGRIPGAKNRFNTDNLGADGTFKQPATLR